MKDLVEKLIAGNERYRQIDEAKLRLRVKLAEEGQHPYAIVICCSDSRVIPVQIFSAELGDLFVIRVAGNVLDRHQIGSVEYAAAHLGTELIVLLGHTGCGAVKAALGPDPGGYVKYITDDILEAVGEEKDPDKACLMNVRHGVERLRRDFADHPEIKNVKIVGAVYDIRSGQVSFEGEV